jgi:hypothetical protein
VILFPALRREPERLKAPTRQAPTIHAGRHETDIERLQDLCAIEDALWAELTLAPHHRSHEWRVGVLATVDGDSGRRAQRGAARLSRPRLARC